MRGSAKSVPDGASDSPAAAALVLAGRREGVDSLSDATGASHKAMVEIGGIPMLLRVLHSLQEYGKFPTVAVSIDEPWVLEQHAEVSALLASGALSVHSSKTSPSASVKDYFETLAPGTELLVTTADHALLTPRMLAHFWGRAQRTPADVVVALVCGERFRARFPDQPRTLIRMRDATYSGANLFAFRGARAAAAAEFWVTAEKFRKQPWKLVGMFGMANLVRFVTGRLDMAAALDRASARIGARIAHVELPYPEAAVDVDKPHDLELVTRIVESAGGGDLPEG